MGLLDAVVASPAETDTRVIQDQDLHTPPPARRQRLGDQPATARQVRKLRKLSKAYAPTPITEEHADCLTRDAITVELQRLEILERPTRAINTQRTRAVERQTIQRTKDETYRADQQATCDHHPGDGIHAGCCVKCGCELTNGER